MYGQDGLSAKETVRERVTLFPSLRSRRDSQPGFALVASLQGTDLNTNSVI